MDRPETDYSASAGSIHAGSLDHYLRVKISYAEGTTDESANQ